MLFAEQLSCGDLFFRLCLARVDKRYADACEILAKSAELRASSWPMITRGLLLIARGRKADYLTFGLCLASVDIAFVPDVGKYRLIACGL